MESKVCPYFGLIGDMCMAAKIFERDGFYSCTKPGNYKTCPLYLVIEKRKDEESMENKTLEKVLDVAGSATKLAANLSEAKKETTTTKPPVLSGDSDNSNNASTGSQNIQIALDTGKKKEPKPVEKHVHVYPENRSLTTEECELDLKKAQMEYDLKIKQQTYFEKVTDRDWHYKLEQEKKNEQKGKIRRIIGGILVAIGVGSVGYSIYADYRDHRNQPVAQKALPEGDSANVTGEGTVK